MVLLLKTVCVYIFQSVQTMAKDRAGQFSVEACGLAAVPDRTAQVVETDTSTLVRKTSYASPTGCGGKK